MFQESQSLDLKKYEQLGTIKETDYSKVIEVIDKDTYKKFCANIFTKRIKTRKPQAIDDLKKEVQIIMSLLHPSIVKTFGYSFRDFKDKDKLVLITENIKNGSLDDIMKLERRKHHPPEWDDTKKLINIYGIAHGMSFLHRQGIVHKQLDPSNIYETNRFYPKIAYFGHFQSKKTDINLYETRVQFQNSIYEAPEIERQDIYNFSCDVFSFGVIFFNIFCTKYMIRNEISFSILIENNPEKIFESSKIPECYKELILRCISFDPAERPTFDEILDQLKNDSRFITNSINQSEFYEYIKRIEEGNLIFDDDNNKISNKNKLIPFILDTEKVDLIEFEKREKLGSGGFGDVYKVKTTNDFYYAAKVSKKTISENDKSSSLGKSLINEVTIQSKMNHPSILKFIGFSSIDFEGELKPTILTEYLKNGSLEKLLKYERNGKSKFFEEIWNDTMRLINIYGIASCMQYLHSQNILHRDLKPENIIFDEFLFPKLSDFGISIELRGNEYNEQEITGTRVFIAPESYESNVFSKCSDVYAFGLLVYEIMNKKYPFEDFEEVNNACQFFYSLTIKNIRPKINDNVPDRYKKLIQSCWSKYPEERPTFKQITYDLRTDPSFLTSKVNKQLFDEYVKFIEIKKGNKKLISSNAFPFHSIDLYSIYRELQQSIEYLSSESSSSLDDYEITEEYQTTITSKFFKVKNRMTGKAFTAKIANFNIEQYTKEDLANIKEEVDKLTKLKHPLIQRFFSYSFGDFEKQPRPVVITEYSSSTTLYDVIQTERKGKTNPYWNDTKKIINIYGIASAMSYLHSHDILHPNLNLKNIFVDDSLFPKLGNIGFFTQVENNKFATHATTNEIGADSYLASPEFLKGDEKNNKTDVYSYSYIIYEILTNKVPFKEIKNFKDLYEEIVNKRSRPPLSKNIHDIYKKLICSCWSDKPDDRPSFDDITQYLEKNTNSITNIDRKMYNDYIKSIKENLALK